MQQFGLRILIKLDQMAENERDNERLRQALLIANPQSSRLLYPTLGEPEEVVDEEGTYSLTAEDTAYDFRQMTWTRPEEVGQEEMELLGRLLGDPNVTVSRSVEALEGVEDVAPPDLDTWT